MSEPNYVNYWQAYAASGSIVLDNVQSTSGTVTLSPFQVTLSNFVVGSGTNKVLIVGVGSNTGTVSGVTYGGVALTPVISESNTIDTEFWILKNPQSGSADIVVTMSAGSTVVFGAYSFFGVDQTNPIPTTAINTDITGDPSITITNNNAFSWVLDSVVIASTSLSNPTQTSQWNIQVIGVDDGASSSAITTQPNTATTFGWTAGAVGVNWAQTAVEVKAAEITQELSETVGITDTLYNSPSKSLTDSISLSDSLKTEPLPEPLPESISISDSIATTKVSSEPLPESISISDSIATTKASSEPLPESISISDSIATTKASSKSLTESISLSDSLKTEPLPEPLSESVTVSDSVSASNPNSIIRTSGGDRGSITPPSLSGSAFSETEYPFSLDGKGYKLPSFTNSIPTTTFETGKPIEISVLSFSNSGPASIQHAGLYTNLHGLNSDISQSDTYIIYEKGQLIQVVDPHNFFSHVSVNTVPVGNKLQVVFDVTFAKPMEKSHIDLRIWDAYRNSVDTKILDAWQIVQSSQMVNQAPATTPKINQDLTTSTQNEMPDVMSSIKEWGGYSPISISDSQLLENLGMHGTHIPTWFMKTTKWVVNNEVNQQEFLNALKYLYNNGIVR